MMALATVIWITLDAEPTSAAIALGRSWTLAAAAEASYQPLFTYPDYQNGLRAVGGFRFVHPLPWNLRFVWSGNAGATYVDDWRALFESSAAMVWPKPGLEMDAGVRHDNRLSREGARSGFRDPTGRVFVSVAAFPVHKGWFAAGVAAEYQRGMPGELRLPSSASASAVVRIRPQVRRTQ